MNNFFKKYISYHLKFNALYLKELKKIETWYNSDKIEELENRRFLDLIKKVNKPKGFYPQFYSKNGIDINNIKSIADIESLPVINKEIVKSNIKSIQNQLKVISVKGHTSGTTGSPLTVYRSLSSIIKENAYVWWYRKNSGLNPKDKKVSIRGDLNRNVLYEIDSYSNTLYISSFNLNDKNSGKLYEIISKYKPKAFLAYPSSLYTLALLFWDKNYSIDIPLTFTSSESLLSYQEEAIKKAFHTKVFDWYGNAERTIALYRDQNRYYEPLLYSLNQYRENKIITTSLINFSFPLIRYEVNDKVVLDRESLSSLNKVAIKEIQGRKEDLIILKDGTRVGRLDLVFKGLRSIRMSQIIQRKNYEVDVNLVVEEDFTSKEKEKLMNNLREKLGNELNISINLIDEEQIQFSSSGKFSLVKSEVRH